MQLDTNDEPASVAKIIDMKQEPVPVVPRWFPSEPFLMWINGEPYV